MRHPPQDRDTAWFDDLYDANLAPIARYVSRRCPRDDVDDVVADVFAVAWRRRAAVPADSSARRMWLYAVARNVLRNRVRSTARYRELLVRLRGRRLPAVEDPLADSTLPVLQALATLHERDREILRLVAWEQCDNAELAATLGCSINAATIRLHRARRRLAAALRKQRATATSSDPTPHLGTERMSRS